MNDTRRVGLILFSAGILLILGPPRTATSLEGAELHPNASAACDLIPSASIEDWKISRKSLGISTWDGAFPALPKGQELVLDRDERHLLLRGRDLVVLLSAPDASGKGGGAVLGVANPGFASDLIRPPKGTQQLLAWRICLGDETTDPESCRPNGKVLTSLDLKSSWKKVASSGTDFVRGRWEAEEEVASVTVDLRLASSALQAKIDVDVRPGSTLGVVSVRFPLLHGAGRRVSGNEQLILPRYNLGIACGDCEGYRATYPSMYQTMPWFGYLDGNLGLYVGAHDPQGRYKTIRATGPVGSGASYFEIYPERSGAPTTGAASDWWFAIEPVCATRGWPALSHVYKSWVESSTAWGRAPRLSARTDIPREIRRGAWWFNNSASRNQDVRILAKGSLENRAQITDGPTVHHWYGWHEPGMDRGFPTYRPRPGVAEGIAEVQRGGRSSVVLYTNGSHTDQSNSPIAGGRPKKCDAASGRFPKYWESTMSRPDGQKYFIRPASGACLVRMDEASPDWRAIVLNNVKLVTQKLAAAGVYIDVTGNIAPGSWSGEFYPPGRGAGLTRASRDLIEEARGLGGLIVTEGALEQLSGLNDASVNYLDVPANTIPLFPAVHHERFILAGIRSLPPEDEDALGIKNGLSVAWGLQPGLNSLQWHADSADRNLLWANRLLQAFRALEPWLGTGEYMGPLSIETGKPASMVATSKWLSFPPGKDFQRLSRPAIEAGLYKSTDGRFAIAAVNVSRSSARASYHLPRPLRELEGVVISHEELGQPPGMQFNRVSESEFRITLPARSVAAVELRQPSRAVGEGEDPG